MPCQLKEAIVLLDKTVGTKKKLQRILDNDAVTEAKFGKLVKATTDKDISDVAVGEFSKKLSGLIRKVSGVKVTNKQFALEQINLGMAGIDIARFNIRDGIEVDSTDAADIAAKLSAEFYKEVSDGIRVGVDASQATLNAEVVRVFDTINDARGSHFLAHELLHAGTVEYMSVNPNEPATKRIEDIYTNLYNNYKDLGLTPGYWMTNVDEFIAESMSNPKLIKELLAVKSPKPVSRLSNMYEILLNNMLQLMGFKGKELGTLFDVILDSTLLMLESKVPKKPVKEDSKDTKVDSTTTESKAPKKDDVAAKNGVEAESELESAASKASSTNNARPENNPTTPVKDLDEIQREYVREAFQKELDSLGMVYEDVKDIIIDASEAGYASTPFNPAAEDKVYKDAIAKLKAAKKQPVSADTKEEQAKKESATMPASEINETPIKDDISSKRKSRLKAAKAKMAKGKEIMTSLKTATKTTLDC